MSGRGPLLVAVPSWSRRCGARALRGTPPGLRTPFRGRGGGEGARCGRFAGRAARPATGREGRDGLSGLGRPAALHGGGWGDAAVLLTPPAPGRGPGPFQAASGIGDTGPGCEGRPGARPCPRCRVCVEASALLSCGALGVSLARGVGGAGCGARRREPLLPALVLERVHAPEDASAAVRPHSLLPSCRCGSACCGRSAERREAVW